jgi:hypothetical protein
MAVVVAVAVAVVAAAAVRDRIVPKWKNKR